MAATELIENEVPAKFLEGWMKNHLNDDVAYGRLLDDQVLIAKGRPVGLLLAYVLAHYGVRSTILERNNTTTKSDSFLFSNCKIS